jgi:glutaredoxin-related protein
MIESTQMGHHKAHESKNQKVFTTYIDGILVDGSNILYTMVPKGELVLGN